MKRILTRAASALALVAAGVMLGHSFLDKTPRIGQAGRRFDLSYLGPYFETAGMSASSVAVVFPEDEWPNEFLSFSPSDFGASNEYLFYRSSRKNDNEDDVPFRHPYVLDDFIFNNHRAFRGLPPQLINLEFDKVSYQDFLDADRAFVFLEDTPNERLAGKNLLALLSWPSFAVNGKGVFFLACEKVRGSTMMGVYAVFMVREETGSEWVLTKKIEHAAFRTELR